MGAAASQEEIGDGEEPVQAMDMTAEEDKTARWLWRSRIKAETIWFDCQQSLFTSYATFRSGFKLARVLSLLSSQYNYESNLFYF